MGRGKKLTGVMVYLTFPHLAVHTAVGLRSDLLANSQGFFLTRPLPALILPSVGQGILVGTATVPPRHCVPSPLHIPTLQWPWDSSTGTHCPGLNLASFQHVAAQTNLWPGLWGHWGHSLAREPSVQEHS